MQYNLRYTLSFTDIHLDHPALWEVEIYVYEEDTSEGVFPLQAAGDPLTIIRGAKSDDKMEPILGSEVDISIEITEALPDQAKPYFTRPLIPEDFYANGETDLRVDVKKDGDLFWRGFVKPDFCEYEYTNDRIPFTIVATDRIALMKSQYPDILTAKEAGGYILLSDLIGANGIYKTQVTDKSKVLSSLLANVSDTNTFYQKDVRYEILQDTNRLPISVYDAQKLVNKSFGFRLFYEAGYFWFQRIEDMVTETPDVYDTETNTMAPMSTFRKDLTGYPVAVGGLVRIGAPLKEVDFDIDYTFKNWLRNPAWSGFTNANFGTFAEWGKIIEAGPDEGVLPTLFQRGAGTEESPYVLFFPQDTDNRAVVYQTSDSSYDVNGEAILITGKVSLSFPVKFINTTGMNLSIYLLDPGIMGDEDDQLLAYWGQLDTGEWAWIPRGVTGYDPHGVSSRYTIDRSGDKQSMNFQIQTDSPEDVNTYDNGTISLRGTAIKVKLFDADGTWPDDGTDPGAEIGEITLSVDINESAGVVMKYSSAADYSQKIAIENAGIIDKGSSIANSVLSGAFPIDGWASDYEIEARLQDILLYSYLNVYGRPFRVFEANIYANDILFQQVLSNVLGPDDLYMQISDEYNVHKCMHNIQLIELNHGVFDPENVNKINKEKLINA